MADAVLLYQQLLRELLASLKFRKYSNATLLSSVNREDTLNKLYAEFQSRIDTVRDVLIREGLLHKEHYIDVPPWQRSITDKCLPEEISKRLIWPLIPYFSSSDTLPKVITEETTNTYIKYWKQNRWPYKAIIDIQNQLRYEDDFVIGDFQFIKLGKDYGIQYRNEIYSEQQDWKQDSTFDQFLKKLKYLILSLRLLEKDIGIRYIWIESAYNLHSMCDLNDHKEESLFIKESSRQIDISKNDIASVTGLLTSVSKDSMFSKLVDKYNMIFNAYGAADRILKIYFCLEEIYKVHKAVPPQGGSDLAKFASKTLKSELQDSQHIEGVVYYGHRIRNRLSHDSNLAEAFAEVDRVLIKARVNPNELDKKERMIFTPESALLLSYLKNFTSYDPRELTIKLVSHITKLMVITLTK
jgi:hypothetical protein